jgi:hypothetical protein
MNDADGVERPSRTYGFQAARQGLRGMGRIKRVFVGANPSLSNPNVVSFERPLQIGLSSGAPSLH